MIDVDPAKVIKGYLDKKNMAQVDFVKICGISKESLRKYLKGGTVDRINAKKIEKHTRGEILYESLTKYKRK